MRSGCSIKCTWESSGVHNFPVVYPHKQAIVTFSLSLVDALLFVHYAAVLLLEIRQLPARYYVHVIRSPDGASRGYPIGAVSVILHLTCGNPAREYQLSPVQMNHVSCF